MFRHSAAYYSNWEDENAGSNPGEESQKKGKTIMAPSNLMRALAGLSVESELPIGLVLHASEQKRIQRTAITRITERKRMTV